jgi:hypothetical protein
VLSAVLVTVLAALGLGTLWLLGMGQGRLGAIPHQDSDQVRLRILGGVWVTIG